MFDYDPYTALAQLRPVPALTLTSPDLEDGSPMPLFAWSSSRGGEDRAPALQWSGVPEGTQSFAISCYDPDAPTGSGFWHWAAYNIPADVRDLASGDGSAAALPTGSVVLRNESGSARFIGSAPPEGTGVHRYFFVVDALDVPTLDLPEDATPAVLGFNRHFRTLARGILVGTADPAER